MPSLSPLHIQDWTNKEEFIEYLVAGNRVQLLRNTTVATWSGLNRWQDLALFVQDLGLEEINQVKLASCGRFSDADMSAPLGTAYEWQSTFTSFNTTATELIATVQQAVANHSQLVYFSSITSGLHQHLKPDRMLYLTEEDWMYRRQFVWLSTKGSTTHTHFDQDYNVSTSLYSLVEHHPLLTKCHRSSSNWLAQSDSGSFPRRPIKHNACFHECTHYGTSPSLISATLT
jgi:hypothetical protein